MNKFILLFSMCFILSNAYSQDTITKKNGEDLLAKVIEVGQNEIKYRQFNNLEGPIYSILKSDVLLLHYENGQKDVFAEKSIKIENHNSLGQMDASKHYRGYKGAGTGTLVASLVSPLIGLVPAIITSSTEPKDENLMYPNIELMKNPDYYNGYTKKSKKIKSGKVWKNWGIGLGVNLVAVLLIAGG